MTTQALQRFYSDFNRADMGTLERLYEQDAVFRDPAHYVKGRDAIRRYFEQSRSGLLRCEFEFHRVLEADQQCAMEWSMHFSHRRLRGGKELVVAGCSILTYNADSGRVQYHSDYFDLGAMLYEHIPCVGALVASMKQRIGGAAP